MRWQVIVVNRNWLIHLGMPAEVAAALEETRGLMLAELDTFAAGISGARYTSALVRETHPRTLLLLGIRDRHGAASGMTSSIEIGLSGATLRYPTPTERRTILESLGMFDHPTASAIEAAVHEAPMPPGRAAA